MEKRWEQSQKNLDDSFLLADKLGISQIIAELLVNRGIKDPEVAKQFLECDLKDLHDPYLLKGMKEAITRIKEAIISKEKIVVFGDFDVDGVTSTTILYKVIDYLGGDVYYHFPNRLTDGYGLNKKVIEGAKKENFGLIISVDCGITANDEARYAKEKGVDLIIIDHHEQIGEIPMATSVIDPKQKGCNYPYKKLAAVGVVFKVIQALVKYLESDFNVYSLLDFVALGTVADLVPLDGENRILVKNGLNELTNTRNLGLKALIEVSGLQEQYINSGDISFKLGPRINSSGRLGSADKVMTLFNTDTFSEAVEIAKELDQNNTERKNLQERIFNEAVKMIEGQIDLKTDNCIVLASRGWHRGIIGIVASKIVERYYRPTILISVEDDGYGYGSCRSIPKFHLLNAISNSKSIINNYGGHSQAAGLRIEEGHINDLRKQINEFSKDKLSKNDLIPILNIDSKIDLDQVDFGFIEDVHQLFPYGLGNPKPVFCSKDLSLDQDPRVLKEKHLKLNFCCNQSRIMGAIGFNMSHFNQEVINNNGSINIAFFPEINEWNGNIDIQLGLKDIKFGNLE